MAFFTLRSIALFATTLALVQSSLGAPTDFKKQNALDAQKLNAQFEQLKSSDSCTSTSLSAIVLLSGLLTINVIFISW